MHLKGSLLASAVLINLAACSKPGVVSITGLDGRLIDQIG